MPRATDSAEWVESLDRYHLLTPIRVFVVLATAVVLTIVIKKFVSKGMRKVFDHTVPADLPRAEARYRTLSSSLRSALIGVVWTIAVIIVVSELGVNIGAFVATATIVGGAIAFGAQTLIRDVIAGFFVVADDQFGVGDDVDLGHASGTVERVTLRTVRFRDGEGKIWHVQHGNVIRVVNLSKASVAFLDVEVARSMSVDRVSVVIKRLGRELAADDSLARVLTSPPILVGVTDVRDDRLVMRMTVATLPGQREAVTRAWRVLALGAFASGELDAPRSLSHSQTSGRDLRETPAWAQFARDVPRKSRPTSRFAQSAPIL